MEFTDWKSIQQTPNSRVWVNYPIPTADKRKMSFAGIFAKTRQRHKIKLGLLTYLRRGFLRTQAARKEKHRLHIKHLAERQAYWDAKV